MREIAKLWATRLARGLTFMSCLGAALAFAPARARACGGCFSPPTSELQVVTGHRMAYAIAPDRTVLWDQISYSGAPQDFAWVLPVKPGATLELSRDAWFEALDVTTQTQVTAPKLVCATANNGGGCDCAAGSSASPSRQAKGNAGGFDDNGVTVLHRQTIGPYDTVTLRSTNGDALTTWLESHGYVIPQDIAPIVSAYVTEGFDFIALRLSPGQGVQSMAPVRVVTPGPEGPLPLRMVAAGVGDTVNILLWVIGESRYALPELNEVSFDQSSLSWDFVTAQSNYPELRARALAQNLQFSYLTTFSDRGAFYKTYATPSGSPATYYVGSSFYNTLADVYFAQSKLNDGLSPSCPSVNAGLQSSALVSAPASAFNCGGYDDIGAAMIGQHPSDVWLSRLELDLKREALNMDCVVQPGPAQTPVSNQLLALKVSRRPSGCEEPVFESGVVGRAPVERGVWLVAFGALALGRLRRRSRPS